MSGGHESSSLVQDDVVRLLATYTHIGTTNVDHQMEQYIYARRADGTHIINLKQTWEKLLLAARAIAAVENPADVIVVSARQFAHRALMKYAAHTGATPVFGRFAPGALTNQIQKNFKEPRIIIISDPRIDHQVVTEASYANVPIIAFTNSDSPLKLIDIAIPCNNKMSRKELACPSLSCDYTTPFQTTLRRHALQHHGLYMPETQKVPVADGFACSICPKEYATLKSLREHERKKHAGSSTHLEPSIMCSECDEGFYTHQKLVEHAREQHDRDRFENVVVVLQSEAEFAGWLKNLEHESFASFSIRSSSKNRRHFRCSYSGMEVKSPPAKKTPSSKGCTNCTAYLNVTTGDDGVISVQYCSAHNHDPDVRALRRAGSVTEDKVLYFLEMGLEPTKIIERLRAPFKSEILNGEEPRCLDFYITKQDINTVMEKFNLTRGRLHKNDLLSVEEAVSTAGTDIQFYSAPLQPPNANGFCLVIMTKTQRNWLIKYGKKGCVLDDTHGITQYTLRLTTALVIDEYGRGLPVAFMISAQLRVEDLEKLFQVIKRADPNFAPEFFMTDDDANFWAAYCNVFPQTGAIKLLCRWHQMQTLKRNLKRLKNKSIAEALMSELRMLFYLNSKSEFKKQLDLIRSTLKANQEDEFLDYFEGCHVARAIEWACWARFTAPFTTSMAAEAWHHRLKSELLAGKRNARVDSLVTLLSEYPLRYYTHLMVLDARFSTSGRRQEENNRRHKLAVQEYQHHALLIENETFGRVPSSKEPKKEYKVVRICACPCDKTKNLHCRDCGACPYSWVCQCMSSTMAGVSCKHQHAIHIQNPRLSTLDDYDVLDVYVPLPLPTDNEEHSVEFDRAEPIVVKDTLEEQHRQVVTECENAAQAVGLMWWLLAREVLILRGKVSRDGPFLIENTEIMPDLYFFRDPAEIEKEQAAEEFEAGQQEAITTEVPLDFTAAPDIKDWAAEANADNWNGQPAGQEWGQAPAVNQW